MIPTMFLGMVLVDPGLHSTPGQEFDQIRILNTFVTTNQDNNFCDYNEISLCFPSGIIHGSMFS